MANRSPAKQTPVYLFSAVCDAIIKGIFASPEHKQGSRCTDCQHMKLIAFASLASKPVHKESMVQMIRDGTKHDNDDQSSRRTGPKADQQQNWCKKLNQRDECGNDRR